MRHTSPARHVALRSVAPRRRYLRLLRRYLRRAREGLCGYAPSEAPECHAPAVASGVFVVEPCREVRYLPTMKKKVTAKKLVRTKLTLKTLTVAQIADAKGGTERLPRTSRRPDCGCA